MTYNKKVIIINQGFWRFWDFVYQNDSNPIEDWYVRELSEDAQLIFVKILKDNRKTDQPINWVGFKRFLAGKYRDYRIWELSFYSDGRQHRVFGVFGPGRKEATLLVGCYHKGHVYTPPDAMETAYNRARLLSRGEAMCYERKIPIDQ